MDNFNDFFNPVNKSIIRFTQDLPKASIGKSIVFHEGETKLELIEGSIVLLGIPEGRTSINNEATGDNFIAIREEFYKLFMGNWGIRIYDLGNLKKGDSVEDTDIALREIITHLLKNNLTPIVLGGSQALTYSLYRAFDKFEQKVNLGIVDARFDLGEVASSVNSTSYLTRIIMDSPNNLFNLSHIGYQSFLNSQEEINLFKTLLFDTYRLGEVKNNIEIIEPALREIDLLSIDLGAVKKNDAPANNNAIISGFSADEICQITRYAGLSDKLSIFGIFEYNAHKDIEKQTAALIGQMLWYFIEGYSYRFYEFPSLDLNNFKKYNVIIDDEVFHFYKSKKSNRWWMEINIYDNNKIKRRTLLPCTYQDYLDTTNQEIPDRWLINRKKFS